MTTFNFQPHFELTEGGINTPPKKDLLIDESFHFSQKIIQKEIIYEQKNDDHFVEPQLLPFLEQEIQSPLSLSIICTKEEINLKQSMIQDTLFPLCIKAQEITLPSHLTELEK
ncbi:hypothetical protein M0813_02009 [Anaeramoeba flamelloides]|uniref:Uncharacterized protein n=1 Tax=Anaeramoeba flamelloides TaxID=1746091 RepID=A0ABQ8YQ70_9EUKA|nr:hypothetical protein M0813_02009 [Anaeramoeba flamelloides]